MGEEKRRVVSDIAQRPRRHKGRVEQKKKKQHVRLTGDKPASNRTGAVKWRSSVSSNSQEGNRKHSSTG